MPPSVEQSLRKAKRFSKSGDIDQAAMQYQGILQKYPQNQRALAGLNALALLREKGLVCSAVASQKHVSKLLSLMQQGKLQEALILGESLQAQFPADAKISNLLGTANANLGRYERAVDNFTRALQLDPNFDLALSNRGSCLYELGRTEEAIDNYRHALRINSGNANAHYNLGVAFQGLQKLDDSVCSYRQAVVNSPKFADAHYNLGHVLRTLGNLPDAIASYRHAITARPDFVEAHTSLGNALRECGEYQEAIACFNEALSFMPEFASAHHGLGMTFQVTGNIEEAMLCYRKAISCNPEFAEPHMLLAQSKKCTEYDDDMRLMEKCYTSPTTDDAGKMKVAFGLGKSYGDIGEYEKAFDHYLTGNALQRKTFQFSIEEAAQKMEEARELFSTNLFREYCNMGFCDETAIFIVGMPRSGTSLVEQILASHTSVFGAGELTYLKQIVAGNFTENNSKDLGFYRKPIDGSKLALAGKKYIELLRKEAQGESFVTDKMPLNFRLIGMIKLMLPNAKVIHCCRDPRDTCLSIFKCLFSSEGNRYAYDLVELGRYHNLYRDLMAHWHSVLPGFVYDIQYEELVADQDTLSRSLLAFCGLEWDDACMEFYKTIRPVRTASFNQVRSPIYRSSVAAWKQYERQLAPLLDVLTDPPRYQRS